MPKQILLIGDRAKTNKVARALCHHNIDLKHQTPQTSNPLIISNKTISIIICTPTKNITTRNTVVQIMDNLKNRILPIFVLDFDTLHHSQVRSLYHQGIQAVFSWSEDKNILLEQMVSVFSLNRRSKTTSTRPNIKLTNLIKSRVDLECGIELKKVSVDQGEVILSDTFKTIHERTKVINVLERCAGVRFINYYKSKIKHYPISDPELYRKCIEQLKDAELYNSLKLQLEVTGGNVTLKGEAQNSRIKSQITNTVAKIRGVQQITDAIIATNNDKRTTNNTAKKIEKRISQLFANSNGIKLNFIDDIAIISGEVVLAETKSLIEQFVIQNSQVTRIINKIKVSPNLK